jgi:hypothetical protein
VSGANSRILNLNNITMAEAGTYSVTVSNAVGSAASQGAPLTVLPPPSFAGIAESNGSVTLTWSTVSGHTYQLQSATDLNPANWTNMGAAINATNATVTTPNVAGTNLQQFFRVLFVQ